MGLIDYIFVLTSVINSSSPGGGGEESDFTWGSEEHFMGDEDILMGDE